MLKINPNDSDAINEKGNALKELGMQEEANECFKTAESMGSIFSIGNYDD